MIEHTFYLGWKRFYLIDNFWTRIWKVGKSDGRTFFFTFAKRNFRIFERRCEMIKNSRLLSNENSLHDSPYIREIPILPVQMEQILKNIFQTKYNIHRFSTRSIYTCEEMYRKIIPRILIIQHEYLLRHEEEINCPIDHRSVNEGAEPVSSS